MARESKHDQRPCPAGAVSARDIAVAGRARLEAGAKQVVRLGTCEDLVAAVENLKNPYGFPAGQCESRTWVANQLAAT